MEKCKICGKTYNLIDYEKFYICDDCEESIKSYHEQYILNIHFRNYQFINKKKLILFCILALEVSIIAFLIGMWLCI